MTSVNPVIVNLEDGSSGGGSNTRLYVIVAGTAVGYWYFFMRDEPKKSSGGAGIGDIFKDIGNVFQGFATGNSGVNSSQHSMKAVDFNNLDDPRVKSTLDRVYADSKQWADVSPSIRNKYEERFHPKKDEIASNLNVVKPPSTYKTGETGIYPPYI